MQAARRLIETMRTARATTWLVVASLAALGVAYASLFDAATKYAFDDAVEYWLFVPSENPPSAILALTAWLLYRRWYRLRALPRSSAAPLAVGLCLVAGVAVHVWAVYTRADDLKIVSLVLGAAGLVLAGWGAAGLRAVWLPIAFLLFALPIPAPLFVRVVFALQMWTAEFAGWLLFVLGTPAFVSGDQIVRATQTFQVVEGCSGIRSIQTLTMLTILMIDLFGRRGWHAALLLLLAPPIALVLNGFRVVTMVLNPHSKIIAIHNLQGIAILIVGLLIVYGIDVWIERLTRRHADASWRPPARPGLRSFSPRLAFGSLACFAGAALASALFTPVWEAPYGSPRVLTELVDAQLGDWPSESVDRDYVFQGSARFREIVHQRYLPDGRPLGLFIATADLDQRGGSLFSPVTARPGSGWMLREAAQVSLEGRSRPVDAFVFEKGKQRMLVYHWYVGSRGLAAETWRALVAIDRSAARRATAPYVVRLEAPIAGHGEREREDAAARLALLHRRLQPVYEALARAGS